MKEHVGQSVTFLVCSPASLALWLLRLVNRFCDIQSTRVPREMVHVRLQTSVLIPAQQETDACTSDLVSERQSCLKASTVATTTEQRHPPPEVETNNRLHRAGALQRRRNKTNKCCKRWE